MAKYFDPLGLALTGFQSKSGSGFLFLISVVPTKISDQLGRRRLQQLVRWTPGIEGLFDSGD